MCLTNSEHVVRVGVDLLLARLPVGEEPLRVEEERILRTEVDKRDFHL